MPLTRISHAGYYSSKPDVWQKLQEEWQNLQEELCFTECVKPVAVKAAHSCIPPTPGLQQDAK